MVKRVVALSALVAAAIGCANVLGLEDGKLAPDDGGTPDATSSTGGESGGGAGAGGSGTGGVDPACAACAASACIAETNACKADPACSVCIDDAADDPFAPPCSDVPGVKALVACACAACPACTDHC